MRKLARHPAARGFADDAAVLEVGGETLVLTHDAMVEGVHFLPAQNMADVAWKLVAVNLSDLAAKGAEPVGVLLGYQLGGDDAAFLRGLQDALEAFNVPLLGGDTVGGTAPRSFGLTAIGRATYTPVPSRSGAKLGDTVWLTGPVGAAMLGYEAVRDGTGEPSHAYRRPTPKLADGAALAPLVTAMMDVSDGLLLDCWRLAEASDVTIRLDGGVIPVADRSRRDECLRWGDDYELLFTLPQKIAPPLQASAIGRVEPRVGAPLWLDRDMLTATAGLGYMH